MSAREPNLPRHARLRAVPWLVGAIALTHYLQWTVVQPADVQSWLGLTRGDLDAGRWWTPLTAVMVHDRLALMLLNAYVLVVAGWRLELAWGTARHLTVVFAATLAAAFIHLFVGGSTPFLGASAAAFATLAASVTRWGDEPQLLVGGFQIPSRWVAFLIGTLLLLTGLESGASFLAHLLGGGIVGAGAMRFLSAPAPRRRARDVARDPAPAPESAPSARPSTPPMPPRERAMAANAAPAPTLDAILDKISAQGLARLTPEERRILDDHSRRLRDR